MLKRDRATPRNARDGSAAAPLTHVDLPGFESDAGPQLWSYFMRLPFVVAVTDNTTFTFEFPWHDAPDGPEVTLDFHQVAVTPKHAASEPYAAGLNQILRGRSGPPKSHARVGQTWVVGSKLNVAWPDEAPEFLDDERGPLSICFERCLAAVNRFLRAYLVVVGGDPSVRGVNKEALDETIIVQSRDRDTDSVQQTQFDLHRRSSFARSHDLDEAEAAEVAALVWLGITSDHEKYPHPFIVQRELLDRAYQAKFGGDDAAAVESLQSSAEVYLRGVLRMLLVDRGAKSAEIEKRLQGPFRHVIEHHLPKLVDPADEGWAIDGSGAVAGYMNGLYGVRNRIAHEGRRPLWHETIRAFDAFDHLREFVVQEVLEDPTKAPSPTGRRIPVSG